MNEEFALFKNLLTQNGLKCTAQRKSIFEAVFSTHRHFDADGLVDILKERGNRISRATVYRTLDVLVKGQLVHALDLGESRKVYEHIAGHKHHDHLICVECGRTIEFDDSLIEQLQERVCESLKFRPQSHSLRIFGKCENCC